MQALLVLAVFLAISAVNDAYEIVFKNGRGRDGLLGYHEQEGFEPRDNVQTKFIDQPLNNFGAPGATWRQRYFVNDRFYQHGGPVFLLLGGEAAIARGFIDTSRITMDWMKNARKFRALTFELEHRFYGESRPTSDISTPNLKYLTSEQALADAATFIRNATVLYNLQGAKWVVFGGSYSANLAAWFREKYPHLVVGAIASSAPVLAKVDFTEYLEVVSTTYGTQNPDCVEAIRRGFQKVDRLMQNSAGRQQLKSDFRLCDSIDPTNEKDLINFYDTINSYFMNVAQYGGINIGVYAHALTPAQVCSRMHVHPAEGSYESFLAAFNYIKGFFGGGCLDFHYQPLVDALRTTSYHSQYSDFRLWIYQTCTEFGYYQTTDSQQQAFGDHVPLSYQMGLCTDVFGSQFNPLSIHAAVNRTNEFYGGRKHFTGTNVVLPNGSSDPWHALGFFKHSPDPTSPVAYIHGTAHVADMYPAGSQDPQELTQARDTITSNIHKWLQ